jgi:hypothetical protein
LAFDWNRLGNLSRTFGNARSSAVPAFRATQHASPGHPFYIA